MNACYASVTRDQRERETSDTDDETSRGLSLGLGGNVPWSSRMVKASMRVDGSRMPAQHCGIPLGNTALADVP